jgi:hypothetical protein
LRETGSETSAGSNILPVVEGNFTALHYFDSSLRGLRPATALEFHDPGGERNPSKNERVLLDHTDPLYHSGCHCLLTGTMREATAKAFARQWIWIPFDKARKASESGPSTFDETSCLTSLQVMEDSRVEPA